MRALALCCATLLLAPVPAVPAQAERPASVTLLDVPYIPQSEALCGGAAAAMVMRYWGERGVSAESFAHLVDGSASGIRTDALAGELRARGWHAAGIEGREDLVRGELARGRPVLTLIQDRPSTFHFIVIVAWHDRGVVFHDPARAPYRVMPRPEFDERWRAADRWMAVVVPAAADASDDAAERAAPAVEPTSCGALVADGVRRAQDGDLDAAERALTAALGCPGPAAARELAGVRLLQRRWDEVGNLASAAIQEDAGDTHAWKLLATSRFVTADRLGALAAWNQAGEPRIDLVRIDGLARTRFQPVARLVGAGSGELLTPEQFIRSRRRLSELPSASSTRLEYVPVPSGLAELRASVAERPLIPSGRVEWLGLGLAAAASREVRLTIGSMTGGGESARIAWRFWPDRPQLSGGIQAPAPWGGIWGLDAYDGRQPFTRASLSPSERTGARLSVSDWARAALRWEVAAGADRWDGRGSFASIGSGLRLVSAGDRVESRAAATVWFGRSGFGLLETSVRGRTTTEPRGVVLLGAAGVTAATDPAPPALWPAGDSGHVRSTLLRAHPALDGGRLRAGRLGRTLVHASLEARRWWPVAAAVRLAGAVFVDAAHTARRLEGPALGDVDAGAGVRLAIPGVSGIFRLDLARGLRDGATALSLVYEP